MNDLPRKWISAGSNARLWGKGGTYRSVPEAALPPVEGPFDGSFDWLTQGEAPMYGMTFEHQEEEGLDIGELVDERSNEASRLGLRIPEAFVRFAKEPDLHSRLSSCTACYWDIGARLVPVPGHKGARLLRFMNDQQACYLWYLLLEPSGKHSVVVAYPEWRDETEGDALEDAADPAGLSICAPSFEAFLKRLWIEALLWNANNAGVECEGELLAYSEAAQDAVKRGLLKVADVE